MAAVETATTRLNTSALSAAACPEHVLATGALQEVRFELHRGPELCTQGSLDFSARPTTSPTAASTSPLTPLTPQ